MRKDIYVHKNHNKTLLMAHIILVTKYRKKILHGEVKDRVMQLIYEACTSRQWRIIRMETDKDHIHILLQYNPADSITKVASLLKQYTTYYLWRQYGPVLRKHYWKEHTFWSDGYFAASIGQVSQATIEHYIENQG